MRLGQVTPSTVQENVIPGVSPSESVAVAAQVIVLLRSGVDGEMVRVITMRDHLSLASVATGSVA